MRTRNMNVRITFFQRIGGQNEDGEVLDFERKDLYTCWAEVSKTSIKDFRESATVTKASGLVEHKDTKTFLIRHLPKLPFDNSCYVDFDGNEYQIVAIERDHANKEIDLIKGVMLS
jgi:hypothetical protein